MPIRGFCAHDIGCTPSLAVPTTGQHKIGFIFRNFSRDWHPFGMIL